MLLRLFCILFWLSSASAYALAGNFDVTNGNIVYSGSVFKGDLARFRAITASANGAAPIVVNVTSGDFDAAIAIGTMIREAELTTTTGLDDCSNLCSLIWLAGRHRTLPEDGGLDFSSDHADNETVSRRSIVLIQYLTGLALDVSDIAVVLEARRGKSTGDPERFVVPPPPTDAVSQPAETPTPASVPLFRPDYQNYEGQERDGAPHGTGVLVTRSGDVYSGKFSNGRPQGPMTVETVEGDQFTGRFKAGKMHGRGTLETADGDIFKGIWDEGTQVTLNRVKDESSAPPEIDRRSLAKSTQTASRKTLADGTEYRGTLKDGKPEGSGVLLQSDGVRFSGWFVNGRKNGPGVLKRKDGTVIAGVWENDKLTGDGEPREGDGREEIEFVAIGSVTAGLDKSEIAALQKRLNALHYKAGIVDGRFGGRTHRAVTAFARDYGLIEKGKVPSDLISQIHGRSGASKAGWQTTDAEDCRVWTPVVRSQASLEWSGSCIGGYVDGIGTLKVSFTLDGKPAAYIYYGQTSEGQISGRGGERWEGAHPANGDRYSGEFVFGYRQGQGSYFYADGSVYKGGWVNGMRSGKGEFESPRLGRVVGEFANDLPNGDAEYFDAAGKLRGSGVFTDGCIVSNKRKINVFTAEYVCEL
ncbi:peptidoglycan-binding protein [Hoeflea sp. CAU 1731]